jgi:hypothetical protein
VRTGGDLSVPELWAMVLRDTRKAFCSYISKDRASPYKAIT